MTLFQGNRIFVGPNDKAYDVASNLTNYVEVGARGITDYYLEAMIEGGEFRVNARINDSSGKEICQVVDSFPTSSGCRREDLQNGYRIVSASGEVLLSLEADGNTCRIRGTIYDSQGNVVCQGSGGTLLIYKGPAVIGRSGNARGIFIS